MITSILLGVLLAGLVAIFAEFLRRRRPVVVALCGCEVAVLLGWAVGTALKSQGLG